MTEISDRIRELLREFSEVQAQPITNGALTERMRTDATTWINAAHLQHWRINQFAEDPWQTVIDIHFFVIALSRLRRAIGLATNNPAIRSALIEYLIQFDEVVSALKKIRNVAEHFDDYTMDRGHAQQVKRH